MPLRYRPYLVAFLDDCKVIAFRRGKNLWFYGRVLGVNASPILMRILHYERWRSMSKHDRKVVVNQLLTRLDEDQPKIACAPPCRDPDFLGRCPNLWDLLAYRGEMNGRLYRPGTLYVSVVGDVFRLAYYHAHTQARAEQSSSTLWGALCQVETYLIEGGVLQPTQGRYRRK